MTRRNKQAGTTACHCGSGFPLVACCVPFMAGLAHPSTAEQLMRSRYTASVLGNIAWLAESWGARTRPAIVAPEPGRTWLGLKIRRIEAGGIDDRRGVVEFVARYRVDGRAHRLVETSRFERDAMNLWRYVDGDLGD